MPARTTDTPPGYYLLFALNGEGVPSWARSSRSTYSRSLRRRTRPPPSTPAGLAITKVQGNPRLIWNAATDNVGVAGYAIHRSTDGTVGPGNHPGRGHDLDRRYGARGHEVYVCGQGVRRGGQPQSGIGEENDYGLPGSVEASAISVVRSWSTRIHSSISPGSTDNVGVVGYNVYRSTNGTLGPLFQQIAGPGWIDTSAQQGVRYTYAVRARDAAGYLSHATPLRTITAQ